MTDVANMKEVITAIKNEYITKNVATDIVDLAVNKAISKRQGTEPITKVIVRQKMFLEDFNGILEDFNGIIQCELVFNHNTMCIMYANLKLIKSEVEYRK